MVSYCTSSSGLLLLGQIENFVSFYGLMAQRDIMGSAWETLFSIMLDYARGCLGRNALVPRTLF